MEVVVSISNQDVVKEEPVTLFSPKNPTPVEKVFLSNIDQAVAFPVETVFFFEVPPCKTSWTLDISERMKKSVSEVLLIPYYFMAGRLNFNLETKRLELVCSNAGVPFVTRFECGGFSIGFMTNHSVLDGKSAGEMFQNLASICSGEGLNTQAIYNDRTCLKARNPPQIKYPHTEYTEKLEIASVTSSFSSPNQPTRLLQFSSKYSHKLFCFTSSMLSILKGKAMVKCSNFEAIVAHLWRARSKAVFDDPDETSTILFAVDIRSKISPPLPHGFTGNAVVTAFANAKVVDLAEKPLSFCVELVKGAMDRVSDDYVRSVIDWLEIHKGVPATINGNFYLSAWWKLPFHDLNFGCGKLIHCGPIVSGTDEFVLLLSDFMGNGGGINVWMGLEKEKMQRFMLHVYEI
uniref:Omega-hydroxypalmitate O-feruloyl transferase-like n=1 Tax=Nelumbo nucifera TaxID=4432 RepID=A0A822Z3G5_NELNU|nr:TPA_asm: hypothetical protein HUJ06_008656 [Nelumbo nucifera]